jgi:hypothetical protein
MCLKAFSGGKETTSPWFDEAVIPGLVLTQHPGMTESGLLRRLRYSQ